MARYEASVRNRYACLQQRALRDGMIEKNIGETRGSPSTGDEGSEGGITECGVNGDKSGVRNRPLSPRILQSGGI